MLQEKTEDVKKQKKEENGEEEELEGEEDVEGEEEDEEDEIAEGEDDLDDAEGGSHHYRITKNVFKNYEMEKRTEFFYCQDWEDVTRSRGVSPERK